MTQKEKTVPKRRTLMNRATSVSRRTIRSPRAIATLIAATALLVTACNDYDCDDMGRVIARCIDGSEQSAYFYILEDEDCPQPFGETSDDDHFWSVGGTIHIHYPTGRTYVTTHSVDQEVPADVAVADSKGRILVAPPPSAAPCVPPNKPGPGR